jgi:hypothetical protein
MIVICLIRCEVWHISYRPVLIRHSNIFSIMASESDEFCPIPFPEGLPEIQLHRVSLTKLLNDDEEQCRLIYDICTGEGFFYLDLTDHPKGLKLLDDVRTVYRVAKDVYNSVSMKDKYTFKPRGSYETELPDTG